jgi:hypothetical protein
MGRVESARQQGLSELSPCCKDKIQKNIVKPLTIRICCVNISRFSHHLIKI